MEKVYEVTAANGLRLRESAPNGNVITVMPHGTQVELLEKSELDGWWKVQTTAGKNIETGYASAHFLMELNPRPKFRVPFFSSLEASFDRVHRFVGTVAEQYGEEMLPKLNEVLTEYKINRSPRRFTHFMAQLAHESGHFRYTEENLNYSATGLWNVFRKYFDSPDHAATFAGRPQEIANRVYANRMGNGDEASGDGYRYRGRGFIQLTGKDNYRQIGRRLGLDLVENPDLVASDIETTLRVAADFWDSRQLNRLADKDDLRGITKRINGGYNGLADRKKLLAQARAIWG
ncbi:MAG: glycoside hydrolase family 19 protein [Henriciella sp.]|nr:glycoside hydrolase family 19 protein [Henriciella sp.]